MLYHVHRRKSSFERTFGYDPEDEFAFTTLHVKIDSRRSERIKKKLRVEAARRELHQIVTSDAYSYVPRGSKKYRIEHLRIIASRSK